MSGTRAAAAIGLACALAAVGACGCAREQRSGGDASATSATPVQERFPSADGGLVEADRYGDGARAVVMVHGGRWAKASWADQARTLAGRGFRVLAINLRGYGGSRGGDAGEGRYELDVLGAVRYLRSHGAVSVSLIGASMGGLAAAQAAVESAPGEIDRLVLIAPSAIGHPERIKGRKLYILAKDDPNAEGKPRLIRIRDQFDRAPEPKELVLLEGSAHAQAIFATDQGPRLMAEIERFLMTP